MTPLMCQCPCPDEVKDWAGFIQMAIWLGAFIVGWAWLQFKEHGEREKRRAADEALWASNRELLDNLEKWLKPWRRRQ